MRTIAFTGHRPDKLPGGYNGNHSNILNIIELELRKQEHPIKVITGGALGIDQLALQAALNTREDSYHGVKIVVAEPFKFFWRKWPPQSIENYLRNIFDVDIERILVDDSEIYAPWKMQKRNEWMVDRCDELWAWWDGSSGGTKNCIDYAKKKDVIIRNLYEEFHAARR